MNRLLLLFGFIILVSCRRQQQPVNPLYVPSDEAKITTLAFNATVRSDTAFKHSLIRDASMMADNGFNTVKEKNEYNAQRKQELDSLKNALDTANIYALIADTLIRMPKGYLRESFKLVKENKDFDKVYKGLDNWDSEIIINKDPGTFNMKNLEFTYNYNYVLKSRFKKPLGKAFYRGIFGMSAAFFNSNKTKAFVYTEIKYRAAYEIFFIKSNGKWSIFLKSMSWIS
jgi:hypothetical protein